MSEHEKAAAARARGESFAYALPVILVRTTGDTSRALCAWMMTDDAPPVLFRWDDDPASSTFIVRPDGAELIKAWLAARGVTLW